VRSACKIICFFEDVAHERFIKTIVERAGQEIGIRTEVSMRNATHGSRVWRELEQCLKDIQKGVEPMPDVLVVVIDGNCQKRTRVSERIRTLASRYDFPDERVVCAIPDPHIERWYLEDQKALVQVIPNAEPRKIRYKCERDRYKRVLMETIRKAGIEPLLGGAEYGDEIAWTLDPRRLDRSFRNFWDELRRILKSYAP
jgi:hypothetical protein